MAAPMPPHVDYPGFQAQYGAHEARWGGTAPGVILLGDSRMALWPEAQWSTLGPSVANAGLGGAKVQTVAYQVANTSILFTAASAVVLLIGYNNIATITGDGANDTVGWTRQLVNQIKAKAPQAQVHVILIPPYRPDYRQVANERFVQFSLDPAKYAVIDPAIPPLAFDDPTLYDPDGVHFLPALYTQFLTPAVQAALA